MKKMLQLDTSKSTIDSQLFAVLSERVLSISKMAKTLQDIKKKYPQNDVYRHFFYHLTHLNFDENQALGHWQKLMAFHKRVVDGEKQNPDLRVSALSYFLRDTKKLKSPKFIELKLFIHTQNQVVLDEMTGLYNYRYFKQTLPLEISRALRAKDDLSVAVIDIDNFKMINDQYGHLTGDDVLKKIAKIIQVSIPTGTMAFRYGGEEITIIFSAMGKKEAFKNVEEIRKKIEKHRFVSSLNQNFHVSISTGIATFPIDADKPGALVGLADEALYRAKAEGKNQSILFSKNYRRQRRIQVKRKGLLATFDDRLIDIEIEDVSSTGVKFISQARIPKESVAKIEFSGATMICKVLHFFSKKKLNHYGAKIIDINQTSRVVLEEILSTKSKA